ncbi:MAG: class GN sortase [Thermodesulfobacteriota bacterium]
MKKKTYLTLLLVLFSTGCGLCLNGGWIKAKGVAGQVLLERSWQRSQQSRAVVKGWPWADTHPVARMTVFRLGVDLIVLEGDSGEVLAFGPGHYRASAAVGGEGNCILAGHRDTSFSFLRELVAGDLIMLEDRDRQNHGYRVRNMEVVSREHLYLKRGETGWLTLITCYPFDALEPGGPLRYVVYAEKASAEADQFSGG